MSRLIEPAPAGNKLFAGEGKGEQAQEYGERVAKYVPAEIIAAYLTLLPLVLSGTDPDTGRRTAYLAIILSIGVIFTPLYLWRFPGTKRIKVFHLIISTLAFVVWAYSIPEGLFGDVGIYDRVGAAILLVVFTLASGLFAPSAPPTPPDPPEPDPADADLTPAQ